MKWPWTKTQEPTRTEDSALAEVPGSAPTPSPKPGKPEPPEVKDERDTCPKCRYYQDLPLRDKWSPVRYEKDALGERLRVTCWHCGYEYAQPVDDADDSAQNVKGEPCRD